MGSLFEADDELTPKRANAMALAARLQFPIADLDDDDVYTVLPVPIHGAFLTDASATLHVCTGAVTHCRIITLLNKHTAVVTPTIYLVPSGGAIGIPSLLWNQTLRVGEQVDIEIPFFLAAGDTIRGLASVTGVVAYNIDLLRYTLQPVGHTLKVIQGVTLTASPVSIYPVPLTLVKHAIHLSSTVCNSSLTAVTANIYRVPVGGSATDPRLIAQPRVNPKETVQVDTRRTLDPGDFLAISATTAGVLSYRPTIHEVLL
jgi:hypothetical protein